MTFMVPRSSRSAATASGPRMDPSRELEDIQDRMSQFMRSFFGEPSPVDVGRRALSVPVDIGETDNAYIIELDRPGECSDDVFRWAQGQ
jgi:HSP20 family molecular chaperone IbpA